MPKLSIVRDYRDPHTGLGVDLTSPTAEGATAFLVHECGALDYRDWNHRGIVSPYWRLHHNLSGGNAIRCGSLEFPLHPGSVVLTPAGVRIDTLGRKTVPHLWVHYTPLQEFVLRVRQPVSISVGSALEEVLKLLRAGLDGSAGGPPVPEFRRHLHHCCKSALHLAFAALEPDAYRSFPQPVHRLLEYIESNPGKNLSTPALSQLSGMSPDGFSRWFRRHVGQTPNRYVTAMRMRVAVQQLTLGDQSIDQVADALGYPNRFYFSRVFKKHLGCGPATFRRGARGPTRGAAAPSQT